MFGGIITADSKIIAWLWHLLPVRCPYEQIILH
jgi:hypothetical protein